MSSEYLSFTHGLHVILTNMPGVIQPKVGSDDSAQTLICHLIDRSAWTVQLAWDHGAISKLYDAMTEKAFESLTWSDQNAVVVIRFRSVEILKDVLRRLDEGMVVDPVAEKIAAFAHASSSDPKIFRDAKKHAESLGKTTAEVLAVFTVDHKCHTVVYKNP